ncbi:Aste57867_8648 [Aphanomyces stellatus]|uniref:Aste57867_8648 protein n=1 Tax=Aphanomyces stellatus TaxID=120398 RepID=A0A485KKW7_9STRA|nr:hypothetical protein As57867_008614 [Aphanomyces stellatus]VFT85534.1 Aste57867_8648 [Aphanomyces stellatus]
MPTKSDPSAAAPPAKRDKNARRRSYFKEIRRAYRQDEKNERLALLEQITELEKVLGPLALSAGDDKKKDEANMLPWKDIAHALHDDARDVSSQQVALKTQVKDVQMLVWEMRQWVAANTALRVRQSSILLCLSRGMQRTLDNQVPTWRNVTLLANPTSRRLGKEWITQQLYHNTDVIFQRYGFPAIDSGETIADWDNQSIVVDGCDFTVYRRQVETGDSLADAIAHIDDTLLSVQSTLPTTARTSEVDDILTVGTHAAGCGQSKVEIEGSTTLFALVTSRREYVNLLCGEFRSDRRCVFVLQQILDDETSRHPDYPQRNRMFWHDIQELPTGRTVTRSVAMHSLCYTTQGGIAVDEDAKVIQVNISGCPYMNARQPNFPSW